MSSDLPKSDSSVKFDYPVGVKSLPGVLMYGDKKERERRGWRLFRSGLVRESQERLPLLPLSPGSLYTP